MQGGGICYNSDIMMAVVITTGSELLSPLREETNSLFIAAELEKLGIEISRKLVVGDGRRDIERAVREELVKTDILIITGGLGPTSDDLTVEAAAGALGLGLVESECTIEKIKKIYARSDRKPSSEAMKMALVPEGFHVIDNPAGTAPGIMGDKGGKTVILLPGVPEEMKALMKIAANRLPRSEKAVVRTILNVTGLYESQVNDLVFEEPVTPGTELGISVKPSHISITVTSRGEKGEREAALGGEEQRLRNILGYRIYGTGDRDISEVVVEMLERREYTVSTAESCTGGLIAKRLTDVPGSSACFPGGLVTYSRPSKERDLGVPPETIEQFGAVSAQTAYQMARRVRDKFGSTFGIGITGYAGPSGGEEGKPVGTVFTGLAAPGEVITNKSFFRGDREKVRLRASQKALDILRLFLLHEEGS